MSKKIAVLGAGAWGVTLARLLADNGHEVVLWEIDAHRAQTLKQERKLAHFPHAVLPLSVQVTDVLEDAVRDREILLIVVPSQVMRSVASAVAKTKKDFSNTIIVSAAKGIDHDTMMRMSEVITVEVPVPPGNIAVLSGPTIARDVALGMPTAVTVASLNEKTAQLCQDVFMNQYFRVYPHHDVAGAETGGALKNIIAIAAGICDGLNLGDNTKAALITRSLKEIIDLGTALGGQPATYMGLTGLGDLLVTCMSRSSRNRTLGEKIAQGKSVADAQREIIMVAEGVEAAKSAHKIAQRFKIEIPIMEQIYQGLYYQKPPAQAVQELMARDAKPEMKSL